MKDIFSLEQGRQLRYTVGNLASIRRYPVSTNMGIYMTVGSGTATLNAGSETYELLPEMEVSFISGGVFQCLDCSPDFTIRMFVYSGELFAKIALPIDRIFFEYNEAHPIYLHTPDNRSRTTWREVLLWMDMAEILFFRRSIPTFCTIAGRSIPTRFLGMEFQYDTRAHQYTQQIHHHATHRPQIHEHGKERSCKTTPSGLLCRQTEHIATLS